jgi:hypothetical protein
MFTKTLNKFLILSPIAGRQTAEDHTSAKTELAEPVTPAERRSDSISSSASNASSTPSTTGGGGFLKLGYDRVVTPKVSSEGKIE